VTTIVAVITISYLLGSIPTSIIAGRLISGLDIRDHGSGNAGATNVYRVLGLGPAVAVGIVDVAKGALAVLLVSPIQIGAASPLSEVMMQLIAGGAAVAGHIWTVFAGFRGGKGMATVIGALAFIAPAALSVAVGIWLILLFTLRIMSVASLGAAAVLPIAIWIWETNPDGSTSTELLWFSIILCALIFFTHRSNIGRLIRGEENRLGRLNGAEKMGSASPQSHASGNGNGAPGGKSGNGSEPDGNNLHATGNGPIVTDTRSLREINEEVSREIGRRISSGDAEPLAGDHAPEPSNHGEGI
jgi:glycerol-3-phosphate acyltransferase PlsY